MTRGQVVRDRLLVAAGLVVAGAARRGALVGPVPARAAVPAGRALRPDRGRVQPVPWIFASMFVLLVTTLLGAVLTRRPVRTWLRPDLGAPPAPATT